MPFVTVVVAIDYLALPWGLSTTVVASTTDHDLLLPITNTIRTEKMFNTAVLLWRLSTTAAAVVVIMVTTIKIATERSFEFTDDLDLQIIDVGWCGRSAVRSRSISNSTSSVLPVPGMV